MIFRVYIGFMVIILLFEAFLIGPCALEATIDATDHYRCVFDNGRWIPSLRQCEPLSQHEWERHR